MCCACVRVCVCGIYGAFPATHCFLGNPSVNSVLVPPEGAPGFRVLPQVHKPAEILLELMLQEAVFRDTFVFKEKSPREVDVLVFNAALPASLGWVPAPRTPGAAGEGAGGVCAQGRASRACASAAHRSGGRESSCPPAWRKPGHSQHLHAVLGPRVLWNPHSRVVCPPSGRPRGPYLGDELSNLTRSFQRRTMVRTDRLCAARSADVLRPVMRPRKGILSRSAL